MHQNVFGGAQTCWGSLQHSPDPLTGLKREGGTKGRGKGGKREGERKKGEDPQCLKRVDAHGNSTLPPCCHREPGTLLWYM